MPKKIPGFAVFSENQLLGVSPTLAGAMEIVAQHVSDQMEGEVADDKYSMYLTVERTTIVED